MPAFHPWLIHELSLGGDALLQAEELPGGGAELATGLAHVDGDTLPHVDNVLHTGLSGDDIQ